VTGGAYSVDDPVKIQGRDEVAPGQRNLGALRLERALSALGEAEGLLLLLGAGAGRYARALARERPDLDVIASDLSRVAIHEAAARGGPPAYLVHDAQALPFPADTFGAVVFFDLLEHLPAPDRMLAECARVLAPGGTLHFFTPLEDEPGTLYAWLRDDRPIPIHRWKRDHVGHIQRYRRGDVLARVWRAGLAVSEVSSSFHLAGQTHDIVDYWERERSRGGPGRLPAPLVRAISRGVFLVTWRLAYLEDRGYAGPWLASGLHVTARKAPCAAERG
jgi:SAM-dependent methyltransferase